MAAARSSGVRGAYSSNIAFRCPDSTSMSFVVALRILKPGTLALPLGCLRTYPCGAASGPRHLHVLVGVLPRENAGHSGLRDAADVSAVRPSHEAPNHVARGEKPWDGLAALVQDVR